METEVGEALSVRGLTIWYSSARGPEMCAVRNANFHIRTGESLGLLGESGCGKTTLALSLLRLLPPNARVTGGEIFFRGKDIFSLDERELREVRGGGISLIPQEPGIALCPVYPVGEQVVGVIRAHRPWPRERCRREARALFEQVGLADGPRFFDSYPHQLSGGELQRVAIAQAIACQPQLILADEPTTALDSSVQAGILSLLRDLKAREKTAFLFISHNPAVLEEMADRILVMYGGEIIEEGPAREVIFQPQHPYTQALMKCAPRRDDWQTARRQALYSISGEPPGSSGPSSACVFEPRCDQRMDECRVRSPEWYETGPSRQVRCFKYEGKGGSR